MEASALELAFPLVRPVRRLRAHPIGEVWSSPIPLAPEPFASLLLGLGRPRRELFAAQIMESPGLVDLQPVGRLHLFRSDRGPEKDFLLYPGRNVVGRRPGCAVALSFPIISKIHAIIEIPGESRAPFLRDCGSHNGTLLVKPLGRLNPGVNYQLRDRDFVIFADLTCQYHHLGAPLLPGPQGAPNAEETTSAPLTGRPKDQETLLNKDSKEKEAHGACLSPPRTASDLQSGSPEKATSSRNQDSEVQG
ncbi:mediator of DNA damage checkpoint protein 1-like [Macrotis lagotis]|uniref:mediator of DNA damage checkpoint protein 1-like n=1 Tax=Macrotis lagotis TaxID=92651 RepID=UPI003D69442F